MRNERIFAAARSAQDRARALRRRADDYDDKWRAKCLAEANRAYKDALLWMRWTRPVNWERSHE